MARTTVIVLLSALLLTACRGTAQNADQQRLQIALEPPTDGYPGTALIVTLADLTGVPITDAVIGVEGNMSHAGMAPVQTETVTDGADGAADGRYRVPFSFTMLGDWIITVTIDLPDGSHVQQEFGLTATADGIQPNQQP